MATHDHTGNADEITPQARTLTSRNQPTRSGTPITAPW
jgi:hypothetical protein